MDSMRKTAEIVLVIFLIQNVGGKFLNDSYECNTMSNRHWNLIQWFYGKTNQIAVTYIASSSDNNPHLRLQDKILRGILQSRTIFACQMGSTSSNPFFIFCEC